MQFFSNFLKDLPILKIWVSFKNQHSVPLIVTFKVLLRSSYVLTNVLQYTHVSFAFSWKNSSWTIYSLSRIHTSTFSSPTNFYRVPNLYSSFLKDCLDLCHCTFSFQLFVLINLACVARKSWFISIKTKQFKEE